MAKTLTSAAVLRLKPTRQRREVPDKGCPGLYLVIQPSGAKSWAMRYKRESKPVKLTLGTCDVTGGELEGKPEIGGHLTLPAARQVASEVRRQRALGRDPVAERSAAKLAAKVKESPTSFAAAARGYVEQHCRNIKGYRGWARTAKTLGLSYDADGRGAMVPGGLCERWADRPVAEIGEEDCFTAIDDALCTGIPGRGVRNNGLSSARQRDMAKALGGLFRWLKTKRKVRVNPMTGLARPEPSKKRERVLSDDELRRVWLACDEIGHPFGPIVKLLILTGQRVGEVRGLRRSEVDGETWTIPGERTKNKREHHVPLSKTAMAVLADALKRESRDLIFTTTGSTPVSGLSKMKQRLDGKVQLKEEWRLHDLRRTMATGLQRLGVALPVTEAVLNHVSGSRGGIVGLYQRHDYAEEKRKAIEGWSHFVDALVAGKTRVVVPLKQARRR
jgi:integrase